MPGKIKSSGRLLALVTDAYGGRGGIAQYNRDFLGFLAPQVDITVLARYAPDAFVTPPGLRHLRSEQSRLRYTVAALRLALRQRFDVVFCGHLYMAPLARLVARFAGAAFVVQMHGIEAWQQPTHLCRAAVEAADLVLCVSRYTRAKVLDWAAIAPERVVVLPNTISDAFTPGDGTKFRVAHGLEGKRVLLTVGRIDSRERYKGHDRVIALLPSLVTAGHDVVYVVAGDGDDVPRLQSLAAQIGMTARVRFLGAVGHETLIDAYRAADLFVMPSTGEGFGIAFLEAMACGCPALGLDVAGATDPLSGGLGILASEAHLGVAVAQALIQATGKRSTEEVRRRFGSAAFARHAVTALSAVLEQAAES